MWYEKVISCRILVQKYLQVQDYLHHAAIYDILILQSLYVNYRSGERVKKGLL